MGRNLVGGNKLKLQIPIQPNIGLDEDIRHSVVEILNVLQADEAVLMMNTSNVHWQVRGPGFIKMERLFDQQFHQLITISNDIEERIGVLGGRAINGYDEFLKRTRLEELTDEALEIMSLLADHETFIRFLREDARKCFEEYEDQGTCTLLVNIMQIHEKIAWMLRTFIEPEFTGR